MLSSRAGSAQEYKGWKVPLSSTHSLALLSTPLSAIGALPPSVSCSRAKDSRESIPAQILKVVFPRP